MNADTDNNRSAGNDKASIGHVLIVDDDPIVCQSIAELLVSRSWHATTCAAAEEALTLLRDADAGEREQVNVVLTDVSLPGMDGLALIEAIRRDHPSVVPVVLTGYGTIEGAVRAVRDGAFDFLAKPVVDEELLFSLERALNQQALIAENSTLKRSLGRRAGRSAVVGHDHRMAKALELVDAVAGSKITVLMTGESGTGKSMIARTIHSASPRANGPFVEIHCGSIPETLLESELFGHVKGAFTGAHADKQGKFLAAHGGTLFIDEINSASPAMQMKLLRVLQDRVFEPVGSTETAEVDVRVVLATNQPLERLVAEGAFRQDLYYRINVVNIELPPLRERPGDIPLLARAFIERHSDEHGRTVQGITDAALDKLQRYRYPGNVRELENLLERAVVLTHGMVIDEADLPPHVLDSDSPPDIGMLPEHRASLTADDAVDSPDTPWRPTPLADALAEPEKRIILKALRANGWNRQQTADDLSINRTTLYKKMKTYGLERLAG